MSRNTEPYSDENKRPSTLVQTLLEKALKKLEEDSVQEVAISNNPFSRFLHNAKKQDEGLDLASLTPFERMAHCRKVLVKLDNAGWSRSYHQRQFHGRSLSNAYNFLFAQLITV